jgi:hypothetical protein
VEAVTQLLCSLALVAVSEVLEIWVQVHALEAEMRRKLNRNRASTDVRQPYGFSNPG